MTFYLEDNIIQLSENPDHASSGTLADNHQSVDFKLPNPHHHSGFTSAGAWAVYRPITLEAGKAEQVFLRGFDVDHGTDIAISVDNMPVNMVSHATARAMPTCTFVIPETVNSMSFAKGPYDAKTG